MESWFPNKGLNPCPLHWELRVLTTGPSGKSPTLFFGGFAGGSDSEEFACNARDLGLILESGRSPGGGNGNPLQYSCLETPTDKEPGGYSPWGHKESDMTE